MAVTLNRPRRVGINEWEFTWSSTLTDPTYSVYHESRRILVTDLESIVVVGSGDVIPDVEVRDDELNPQQIETPGRLILTWYGQGEGEYLVEQHDGAGFVEVARLYDRGQGYFQFETAFLPDVALARFRVTPTDAAGNAGTAVEFKSTIARRPDLPRWNAVYNSGPNNVTIDAE